MEFLWNILLVVAWEGASCASAPESGAVYVETMALAFLRVCWARGRGAGRPRVGRSPAAALVVVVAVVEAVVFGFENIQMRDEGPAANNHPSRDGRRAGEREIPRFGR